MGIVLPKGKSLDSLFAIALFEQRGVYKLLLHRSTHRDAFSLHVKHVKHDQHDDVRRIVNRLLPREAASTDSKVGLLPDKLKINLLQSALDDFLNILPLQAFKELPLLRLIVRPVHVEGP